MDLSHEPDAEKILDDLNQRTREPVGHYFSWCADQSRLSDSDLIALLGGVLFGIQVTIAAREVIKEIGEMPPMPSGT